jgi:hypothetical protein
MISMNLSYLVLVLILTSVVNPAAVPANEATLASLNHGKPSTANDFKNIDFRNFSYPYKFSWGKRMNVSLKDGKFEYNLKHESGWFQFSNVYSVDLTNDGRPEALVILSHVGCGVSCDGGTKLFYVYSSENQKLKPLWQYETGSLAYGCGLKSFSAEDKKLVVELFGRCSRRQESTSSTGKFHVKDITRITFGSKGGKIVTLSRTFISTPERSVLNYESQINIRK